MACRQTYIRRHGSWQGNRIERTSCRCHRGRRCDEPKARARWACVCVCCLLCITAAPAAAVAASATALLDPAAHRHRPARPAPRTGSHCMAVCVSGSRGWRCVGVSVCLCVQAGSPKPQNPPARACTFVVAESVLRVLATATRLQRYLCSRRLHTPLRLCAYTQQSQANPWPSIDQSPPGKRQ